MGYRKNWGPPGAARLTCRESQVLELVAEGKRNHEIGECLGISPQTVKIHLSNVYEKFGVNRRIEAASALLSQSSYPRTKAS
ncbi:MAG: helix-turn-helix transcriptional regulator [Dehalococcoidia bacterium]|nr:helix-turn-helix transcriptional regulator [Dehalococcoidia bacterium]